MVMLCMVIIYEYSTQIFMHYILNFDMPPEFEFYNEEMSIVLKGIFETNSMGERIKAKI